MSYPLNDGVVLPIITGLLVLSNFVRGGFVWSDSLRHIGSGGDYWSQVSYSNTYAYILYSFRNESVNPSHYNPRDVGFSLRCVAIGS